MNLQSIEEDGLEDSDSFCLTRLVNFDSNSVNINSMSIIFKFVHFKKKCK